MAPATRARERLLLLCVAAAVLVAAVTDSPLNWTSDYWVDHPMVAALASGLVLFGVAYVLVDRIVQNREAKRWRQVALLAFLDLGQSLLVTARSLEQMLDLDRFEGRAAPGFRGELADRLAQYFDARTDPLPTGMSERVRELVLDPAWQAIAHRCLTEMKTQHRETVAKWGAVMLGTGPLSETLDSLAAVTTWLQRLDLPISQALGLYPDTRPEGWRDELAERWTRFRDILLANRAELDEVQRRESAWREADEALELAVRYD